MTTPVTYAIDANGNLTSDGLRTFDYDQSGRLAKVKIYKDGEEASVRYLVNGMGQRVFKGEPSAEQVLPNEQTLGLDFVTWLKKQFGWLFAQAAANTSVGTAYIYGDNDIPAWAMLGEYDNGSASGKGRTEYIWLPSEDGSAIPIGFFRNGNFFAVHTDHLGTPRLVTNETKRPVWQWPYSAFGNNKPSGVLKATPNPKAAITNKPVLLKATTPAEMNLGMPGWYYDTETNTHYNHQRDAISAIQGRYYQPDPIRMAGGSNRFTYGLGSPLDHIDPTGELPMIVPILATATATGYSTYSLFSKQEKCEKACEMTHGSDVQACGDPIRQDIVDTGRNQRVLACKSSCAFGSIMGRLLPGKLK